jgi:hypothetical protein
MTRPVSFDRLRVTGLRKSFFAREIKVMMRILTFLYFGLAVGLMASAGAAVAESPVPPLSAPQGDPTPRYVPLRDVLPTLAEQTGIDFQVPDSLQDELIPWQEEGGEDGSPSIDWVRNFSHIDLVDEETGQRKIILLTSNSGSAPIGQATPARIKRSVSNTRVKSPLPETLFKNRFKELLELKLSKEKLLKLGGVPDMKVYGLWEDEEYRDFFSSLGIKTSQDLIKLQKIQKVRTAARKILMRMNNDPRRSYSLSKEKALKLSGGLKSDLIHAWKEDEEYRAFYSILGVHSSDHLRKKSSKIVEIRRTARRLLRRMDAK